MRFPTAEVNLVLWLRLDDKARGSQHGFDAGAVGYPPIGVIVRERVLDKVQPGVARLIERSRRV